MCILCYIRVVLSHCICFSSPKNSQHLDFPLCNLSASHFLLLLSCGCFSITFVIFSRLFPFVIDIIILKVLEIMCFCARCTGIHVFHFHCAFKPLCVLIASFIWCQGKILEKKQEPDHQVHWGTSCLSALYQINPNTGLDNGLTIEALKVKPSKDYFDYCTSVTVKLMSCEIVRFLTWM